MANVIPVGCYLACQSQPEANLVRTGVCEAAADQKAIAQQ